MKELKNAPPLSWEDFCQIMDQLTPMWSGPVSELMRHEVATRELIGSLIEEIEELKQREESVLSEMEDAKAEVEAYKDEASDANWEWNKSKDDVFNLEYRIQALEDQLNEYILFERP